MKTRAAIAWGPNQPLEIEEIDLEGPKDGEVLVRIVTTCLCHTDVFTLSGEDPEGLFPCILGHEGCGGVEEVGDVLEANVVDVEAWQAMTNARESRQSVVQGRASEGMMLSIRRRRGC